MTARIGASTGCVLDRPIFEVVDRLVAAGIAGIEVSTPPRHFDPWQLDQVVRLRDRLREAAIQPVSMHAPFGGLLDLSDPNPHHRHAAIGAVMTAGRALKDLGGSILVVHTTDVPRNGQDVGMRLHHCATALTILDRLCRDLDLVLAIESPLPHLIGGSPDEFAWLLDRVGPGARVCLDTSHVTLGHAWSRFVDVARGRLVHVHANDHRGQYDDHLPPGDGIVDWAGVAASLAAVNFDGWIILELNCAAGDIEATFRRGAGQLARLLGQDDPALR